MKFHALCVSRWITVVVFACTLAASPPPAKAWNGVVRVRQLLAEPQAGQHAWFEGAPPHGCWGSGPDGIHEHLYAVGGWQPTANEKIMYATLLSALLSGRHVHVSTSGCDEHGSEIITSVWLQAY